MDLISIRRKYINIRNTIMTAFLLVLAIVFGIIIKEINQNKTYDKIYSSYEKQINQAKEDGQTKLEQQKLEIEAARKAKLPQLTEEAKTNFANIYHSETK